MNKSSRLLVAGDDRLSGEAELAIECARRAGLAIREEFSKRAIVRFKGDNDVLLRADEMARNIIEEALRREYPEYGFVSEDGGRASYREYTWVVDPLDGTNNFGYGIAHCAISIALLHRDRVVLALVMDPLLGREFLATDCHRLAAPPPVEVPLGRATVSVVTNYTSETTGWRPRVDRLLARRCKRATNLWAPALDLALVASGSLDAMICNQGYFEDVCGGVYLVGSAGGTVLDPGGHPLRLRRRPGGELVSFVAARTPRLAKDLLQIIEATGNGLVA
jgi:myo-inositol-1(or 4)-monophosphatase